MRQICLKPFLQLSFSASSVDQLELCLHWWFLFHLWRHNTWNVSQQTLLWKSNRAFVHLSVWTAEPEGVVFMPRGVSTGTLDWAGASHTLVCTGLRISVLSWGHSSAQKQSGQKFSKYLLFWIFTFRVQFMFFSSLLNNVHHCERILRVSVNPHPPPQSKISHRFLNVILYRR